MTEITTDFDVLIIGAGPAGLSLAGSLADQGLAIALVERLPATSLAAPDFDGREIALTHVSVDILRGLGAWGRIPPDMIAPLCEARVLNGAGGHALCLRPSREQGERLGHLVPNYQIRRALYDAVRTRPNVRLFAESTATGITVADTHARLTLAAGTTLTARLVVAADTRFSEMRRRAGIGAAMRDFGASMLVCRMAHETPHHEVATEWFGYGQTIAMLPLNGTAEVSHLSSLVLTLPAREIERLRSLDDAAFGAEITRRYQFRLGAMRPVSSRLAYPLVAAYAERFVAPRFALVGDAAVGMHPVTAHGFNFGLRGQHVLAGLIAGATSNKGDIGAPALLQRYERIHRLATGPLYLATNATARLYTDDRLPARVLREAALRIGEHLPPVRHAMAAKLMEKTAPLTRASRLLSERKAAAF
jgi:ubiquinone biosynthesis UbiH/UbiF/VisC/COQ6 family hydroxylase